MKSASSCSKAFGHTAPATLRAVLSDELEFGEREVGLFF